MAYVAGIVSWAENDILKELSNKIPFELLLKLIYAVSHQENPYFVMQVRSCTDLPGQLTEGI